MRIAICDDEINTAAMLADRIREIDPAHTCRIYQHGDDLMEDIARGERFDTTFMDIEWNGTEKGIRFAEELQKESPQTALVYVTGYTEKYVQEVFLRPSNLQGFLMKPVETGKLRQVLETVAKAGMEGKVRSMLCFRHGRVMKMLPQEEILYLESSAHRVLIHTAAETFTCYGRLDQLAEQLTDLFLRCHKSYCVNMDQIREIGEDRMIRLKDGSVVPVSRGNYKRIRERYFEYVREMLFRA